MNKALPGIRHDIEVIPTEYQGERGFLVRDHLGLISQPILLKGDILNFVRLLDGKRSIRDIQSFLMRQQGGALVDSREIAALAEKLDSVYLLNSERYQEAKARLIADYSHETVRKAAFAGSAYPDDEKELSEYLDSILETARVPESSENPSSGETDFRVRALIAPHIDIEIGKSIYARAYNSIRRSSPKRVLLLGTDHHLQECYFSISTKKFETPFGAVETDKEAAEKMKKAGKSAVAPSDITHRNEHSLEFQIIFLQHLFKEPFTIIPVLCGSFMPLTKVYRRPREAPGVGQVLEIIEELVSESPETLVTAGVDFSHIGPKFGHQRTAADMMAEAEQHDKRLIQAILDGDAEELWNETRRVEGEYNVCGFGALSCLLEVMPDSKGTLLGYEFWNEEPTLSAVSYAAILLK